MYVLAEGPIDCDKSQSARFPHVHDLLATPCANPPSAGRGRLLTVGASSMNTAVPRPGADELDLSTRAAHVDNRSVQVYQFLESRLAVVLALAGARRLMRAMQLRRAVSGRAAVAPPRSVMNSRRLMCCPQSEDCTLCNVVQRCKRHTSVLLVTASLNRVPQMLTVRNASEARRSYQSSAETAAGNLRPMFRALSVKSQRTVKKRMVVFTPRTQASASHVCQLYRGL
jgi:hypothetical protein